MANGSDIGFALGGGAARVLEHIVALEALEELGVRPSFIAGCSISALLWAAYASGLSGRVIREHALSVLCSPGAAVRHLFWGVSRPKTTKPVNLWLFRPVSLNGLGLEQLVSPPGMAKRIEDTDIPFAASIAIPGVIEALRLDGRVMIDGAITNPVPMDQVRKRGCDKLFAVDVTGMPVEDPSGRVPGPVDLILGGTQIMQKEITRLMAQAVRPEVMITPAIDRFAAHDFLKIKDLLDAAEPERNRLKRPLAPFLERAQK